MAMRVRDIELARRRALLAPGLDELAVLGELHDARVGVAAVSVGDEDVAVRRDDDGGRRVEVSGPLPGDAGLAERQQQLAVGAELEHLWPLPSLAEAVGHPDVAVAVDVNAVREQQHSGAEALHQLAGRIELEDRVELRAVAVERHRRIRSATAAAIRPHRSATQTLVPSGSIVDRAGRAPGPAGRQLRPVLDRAIRIGQRIGRRAGLRGAEAADRQQRDEAKPESMAGVMGHGVLPV